MRAFLSGRKIPGEKANNLENVNRKRGGKDWPRGELGASRVTPGSVENLRKKFCLTS